jgi:hypothetical protein
VVGYGGLLMRSWRAWQRRQTGLGLDRASMLNDERRVHAAAFLSLIGVAIAMITDNPLDYLFVMGPLGVLVGLSMGLEARSVGTMVRVGSSASADAGS